MASVGISITGNENLSTEVAPRAIESLRRIEEQATKTGQALGGGGGGGASPPGGGGGGGGAGGGYPFPAPLPSGGDDQSSGPSADWSSVRDLFRNTAGEDSQSDDEKSGRSTGKYGRLYSTLRSAPGVINELGQGQGLGAAGDVLTQGGGLLTSLGFTGVGLAALGIGAGAAGANALSNQYERSLPARLQLAAQQGQLGGSSSENTAALVESLNTASEAANRFGFSLEEGIAVSSEYATVIGNLSDETNQALSEQAFSFARGYGVDTSELTSRQARAQRFGAGDVLGYTGGALDAQGLGPGRFSDQLTNLETIFEEALSRGVVRGFQDVASTSAFFGQAGELFRGAEGAERISQLSSDVAGATGLQREQDVLLYRAARSLGSEDETYVDTLQRLEGGVSEDLLRAFGDQASSVTGGNRTDMIALFQSTFSGLNYTLAETVLDLVQGGDFAGGVEAIRAAPSAESRDQSLLSAQESLRTTMADLGSEVVGLKMETIYLADAFLQGSNNIVEALTGDNSLSNQAERTVSAVEQGRAIRGVDYRGDATFGSVLSGNRARTGKEINSYQDIIDLSVRSAGGGGSFASSGQGILDLLGSAGTDQIEALQKSGTFGSTVSAAESDGSFTASDLKEVLTNLTAAINEMNGDSDSFTVITPAGSVDRNYGGYGSAY